MMLFIFYWCHHNSISGRGRQSALIVYLIKFHLTETMICNQRCNLRLCAKWKAEVANANSSILEHISECCGHPWILTQLGVLICRHLNFQPWVDQRNTRGSELLCLLPFPLPAAGCFVLMQQCRWRCPRTPVAWLRVSEKKSSQGEVC